MTERYLLDTGNDGEDEVLTGTRDQCIADILSHHDLESMPEHWELTRINSQYYAACNVNGPISVSIEAESIETAVAIFAGFDTQKLIDKAECDAEDDLDFDGAGMTECEFVAAMAMKGFVIVKDISEIYSYHGGRSRHLADGWLLFGDASEPKEEPIEMAPIKLSQMTSGQRAIYRGSVVELRTGGLSGGCSHDRFLAHCDDSPDGIPDLIVDDDDVAL